MVGEIIANVEQTWKGQMQYLCNPRIAEVSPLSSVVSEMGSYGTGSGGV